MNQWSESMNHNESVSQWINEHVNKSMNQWHGESLNQWFNGSMNQWIKESVDQGFNEPMNQRFSDLKSQWINAFFRPHLPKVLRDRHFLHFEVQIALALSAAFPNRGVKLQKHRPATMPVKTQGFVPQSAFTHEFTRSRTLSLPHYLMVGLTWWCTVELMVWMLTMTIVRNSEVC